MKTTAQKKKMTDRGKKLIEYIKAMVLLGVAMGLCLAMIGCNKNGEIKKITGIPENHQLAIGGTWVVEKIGTGSIDKENLSEEIKALQGKKIQFASSFVQVGDYLLNAPRYKIKTVDSQKYALYGQKTFGTEGKELAGDIQVVTIYDKDRSFFEVVMVDEQKAILFVENLDIHLKKISDQVAGITAGATVINSGNTGIFFGSRQDGTGKTGVLLGLREIKKNGDGETEYSYRTLWISSVNKDLKEVKERKDIFYPRRNGFWKLWVQSNEIHTMDIAGPQSQQSANTKKIGEASKKWIDFVCNDYISIQTQDEKIGSLAERRVVPVDALPDTSGILASELLGDQGVEAVQEGIDEAMRQHGAANGTTIVDEADLRDFGVERKTGHWFLKGRVFYKGGNGNFSTDYSINIIPPSNLVFYDEAKVAWTDIKDSVPEAVDAFTSPNGDLTLVFTKKNLLIFGIKQGKLELMPLKKISLNNGEQPIMAEWATGKYIDIWGKAFLK